MINEAKNQGCGVFNRNSSIKIIRSSSLDGSLANKYPDINITHEDQLPYEIHGSPRMVIEPDNDDVDSACNLLGSNVPSEVQFANKD